MLYLNNNIIGIILTNKSILKHIIFINLSAFQVELNFK